MTDQPGALVSAEQRRALVDRELATAGCAR
ncbi:hypothetical protein FHU33_3514 [Blastococcus colisei]|uniref:Uncharacterized protein n=1 Tax=Blastococcus colisei TaxID=1564162 RepID=A0A543PIX7_9ACTN|nr:hypothetical protein FHU33_3514 [Blastococcus colisei]